MTVTYSVAVDDYYETEQNYWDAQEEFDNETFQTAYQDDEYLDEDGDLTNFDEWYYAHDSSSPYSEDGETPWDDSPNGYMEWRLTNGAMSGKDGCY
jgi:hypothetical protein